MNTENSSNLYLIGEVDNNGEFWCKYETNNIQDAYECLEQFVEDNRKVNFQIVQKTTTYKVLAKLN